MITEARLCEDFQGRDGLDWITVLRAPAIGQLLDTGALRLSLFDQKDLAEITSPEYPDERLIVCKNPLLAEERAIKREQPLQATERELEAIVAATQRPKRRLRGKDKIALRIGKVLNRFKMAKHFILTITEESFAFQRDTARIAKEAALDGLYVLRTSVAAEQRNAEDTVRTYKGLSVVERAFRSYKTVDLKVGPIYHHLAKRLRAHLFLCMLAYSVEWHMRQALAPLLFEGEAKDRAQTLRPSAVAPAEVSPRAKRKAHIKRTEDGLPVHSFRTLLADLATIVKNRIRPMLPGAEEFEQTTRPTPLQQRALDLLSVRL